MWGLLEGPKILLDFFGSYELTTTMTALSLGKTVISAGKMWPGATPTTDRTSYFHSRGSLPREDVQGVVCKRWTWHCCRRCISVFCFPVEIEKRGFPHLCQPYIYRVYIFLFPQLFKNGRHFLGVGIWGQICCTHPPLIGRTWCVEGV